MVNPPIWGAGFGLVALDAYLVVLLVAAAQLRARRRGSPGRPVHGANQFVVLVPAHDEEATIGSCLASLRAVAYPADAHDVVVVADNCTDATAALARAAGVTVLERDVPDEPGKGHALNWAMDRLAGLGLAPAAIAFVDADCEVTPNFLAEADSQLTDGAAAVQAAYVVSNPEASPATALRAAAFSLINYVRPLGRTAFGGSAGVLGTGMVLRTELIEALRFDPDSIVEDTDLHLRLLGAGERVHFLPDAQVRSPMPTASSAVASQQARWEGGRGELIRSHLWPLVATGVRRRRAAPLLAAADLLVPPLSFLALAHVVVDAALATLGRRGRALALLTAGGHAGFVLGGLALAGTPARTYGTLATAPALVARKLVLYVRFAIRGGPAGWERTAREVSVDATAASRG